MKKIAIFLLTLIICHPLISQQTRSIKFVWDEYSTTNAGWTPDLVFRLYVTTNVTTAPENWTPVGMVTNANEIVTLVSGEANHFYAVTVSNKMFESVFSNVVSTPASPSWSGQLRWEIADK